MVVTAPWSASSSAASSSSCVWPKTLQAKDEERNALLPSITEGRAYQSASVDATTIGVVADIETNHVFHSNNNNNNNNNSNSNSFTTTGDTGISASALRSYSPGAEREEETDSAGYSVVSDANGDCSNGDNNGTDPYDDNDDDDDDKDAEEEEEDDDDDEGPPSLTEAFQSIENRPILRLCAWYLTLYLVVAVVAFSYVFERWTVIDSLFFAVSTFTTCGYGDLEPSTTAGQVFTIFFAIYGVIILGVFIGIVGSFISDHQRNVTLTNREGYGDQVLETLFAGMDEASGTASTNDGTPPSSGADGTHPTPARKKHRHRYTYREAREDFLGDQITLADDVWFVLRSECKPILLVAIGALILGIRERWTITSILYFCVMAASTTGYGDYTPKTQSDKVYCIFFYPLAVCVFGEVLARIAGVYMQRKQRHAEHKFLHRALTLCDLREMDADRDGCVTREEFISYMLVAVQKVEQEFIDDLREIFDNLDATGTGVLEKRDLVRFTKRNYRPLQKIKDELSRMEEWPFQSSSEPGQHGVPVQRGNQSPFTARTQMRHRRFNTVA